MRKECILRVGRDAAVKVISRRVVDGCYYYVTGGRRVLRK